MNSIFKLGTQNSSYDSVNIAGLLLFSPYQNSDIVL